MRAHQGDWLVTEGRRVDQHEKRGEITAIHTQDGTPPYTVRWTGGDGHESLVFPGPDSIVVTAVQLAERDRRAAVRTSVTTFGESHYLR